MTTPREIGHQAGTFAWVEYNKGWDFEPYLMILVNEFLTVFEDERTFDMIAPWGHVVQVRDSQIVEWLNASAFDGRSFPAPAVRPSPGRDIVGP